MIAPSDCFRCGIYSERSVDARIRPAALRPFEMAFDDLLASAFHNAGSDRQPALAENVAAHTLLVGLEIERFSFSWNRSIRESVICSDVVDVLNFRTEDGMDAETLSGRSADERDREYVHHSIEKFKKLILKLIELNNGKEAKAYNWTSSPERFIDARRNGGSSDWNTLLAVLQPV